MNQLSDWLRVIGENPTADVNKEIYIYFSPDNSLKIKKHLARIEKLRDHKIIGRGAARDQLKGKKSRLIGLLFEKLIAELFRGSKAFRYLNSIRTTTSEIDCLMAVEPSGALIPFIRNAGTHLVGEAKFYRDALKTEWVNELVGILEAHRSKMAILFVGCKKKSVHSQFRTAIALHAQRDVFIIPVGLTQLHRMANGENVLQILAEQYVLATAHSTLITV